MKLIFRTVIITAAMLASFTACEDKIDEINVNPDSFPSAPDAQVLTSAQAYYAYAVDVDMNANSFLWAQYYTWGPGVAIGNEERFVQAPDDGDPLWTRSYASVLKDLDYLIKTSEVPVYRGVAKILSAHVYQGLVDHFGDIPFSQALKGEDGIVAPEYDDAEEIYANLITLIDEGLAEFDLAKTLGEDDAISGNSVAGANDLMYGGDLDAWTKFANSLKLRILMRQSETNPQGAAIQALISSGAEFIETEADIAQVHSSADIGNQNPMYARFESGVKNFYIASNAFLDVMSDLGDPRLDELYRPATAGSKVGQFVGIDQGTIDDEPFTNTVAYYSQVTSVGYAIDNPVIFMSNWEVWFLRAEADARYGTTDDEVEAFETAVKSHFDYIGSDLDDASDYLADVIQYSVADPLDDKLDNIAVQKWISMNGLQEDEGWIETRRLDRDQHRIFTNGIFQEPPLSQLEAGEYPSVWLVPSTERSLNPNAPAQRVITDKVFWDN